MATKSAYQEVTDAILTALEAGAVPWRQPWQGDDDRPQNAVSGTVYRGINPFLLFVKRIVKGYSTNRWVTFKQARKAGGTVRAGESGSTVVYFGQITIKDKDDDKDAPSTSIDDEDRVRTIPYLRRFTVFNVDQCRGLRPRQLIPPPSFEPADWDPIDDAELVASDYTFRELIRVAHGGTRACYVPSADEIWMPERERFERPSDYYATLFHEAAHSTGHATRLNRRLVGDGRGNKESYGYEELVAEFAATFLCAHCRLERERITDAAAYIDNWSRAIQAKPRMLAMAAATAQRAADFVLGEHASDADLNPTSSVNRRRVITRS